MSRTDSSSQIKQGREQPLSPKTTLKSTRKRKATPKAAEALLAAKKTKTQSKQEIFDPEYMKNKESQVDNEVKKTVSLKKRKPRKGSKKKTEDPEKEDLKTEEDSRDADKVVTSKGSDCLATNDKLVDVMKAKIVSEKMEDDIGDSSGDENCEYVDAEAPTKEADVCTKLKNPEISRKDFADDVCKVEPLKIFEQAVTVNKEQRQKTHLYRKDLLDFEDLTKVKTEHRKFVNQSTSHINKLATSKNEATTQSSVQKLNGAYGEGVWFPLIQDQSIDRLPNHDEYEPKVVKGTTLKWHKETDVNKKKWWAQTKCVEKEQ